MTAFSAISENHTSKPTIGPCTSFDMEALPPDNRALTARRCTVTPSKQTGAKRTSLAHIKLVTMAFLSTQASELNGRRQPPRCEPDSEFRRGIDCAGRKRRQACAQAALWTPPCEGLSL